MLQTFELGSFAVIKTMKHDHTIHDVDHNFDLREI
jgi:hypothetical protein